VLVLSLDIRRGMVEPNHSSLSVRQQCEALSLSRSGLYYRGNGPDVQDLELMRLIDEIYTRHSFFGYRRITAALRNLGHVVNGKRVQRFMRLMGLEAVYPKKKTSLASKEHRVYPYLLRNVDVKRPNQVWASDITYIRMRQGFLYLIAVMDWYSRYVLSWRMSNTLDTGFCLEALDDALSRHRRPEIFNSDQGCQFTSEAFTGSLLSAGVQISMDGKGRCFDNIFVERLWRSVKYEEVYMKDYASGYDAQTQLGNYFLFYNERRPHQAHNYRTPQEVYFNEHVLKANGKLMVI
jgi:putative transposase